MAAFLLPMAAGAQGTRHDVATNLGSVRVELTLSQGIGVQEPYAALRLQTYFEDRPSARRRDEAVPLVLDRRARRGNSTILTYKVAEDYVADATEFWDRNGIPEGLVAAFPLCLSGRPAQRESMSWRISFPGIGYLPPDRVEAAKMREFLADLSACPTS